MKAQCSWIFALIVALSVTAATQAGPLLDMLSHHQDDEVGYSPLHYWLPGVYRVQACLQPYPPDSPSWQYRHPLLNHLRHGSRGNNSDANIPSNPQQVQPGNPVYPAAPR